MKDVKNIIMNDIDLESSLNIKITPSINAMKENAAGLACNAIICQENGLVYQ